MYMTSVCFFTSCSVSTYYLNICFYTWKRNSEISKMNRSMHHIRSLIIRFCYWRGCLLTKKMKLSHIFFLLQFKTLKCQNVISITYDFRFCFYQYWPKNVLIKNVTQNFGAQKDNYKESNTIICFNLSFVLRWKEK